MSFFTATSAARSLVQQRTSITSYRDVEWKSFFFSIKLSRCLFIFCNKISPVSLLWVSWGRRVGSGEGGGIGVYKLGAKLLTGFTFNWVGWLIEKDVRAESRGLMILCVIYVLPPSRCSGVARFWAKTGEMAEKQPGSFSQCDWNTVRSTQRPTHRGQ